MATTTDSANVGAKRQGEASIRQTWQRRLVALDRAQRASDDADRRFERVMMLMKDQRPDDPDINWAVLGSPFKDQRRSILEDDSIETTLERARRAAKGTFPTPSDADILLQVEKIKNYRLQRDLLDARLGYSQANEASDTACARFIKAEGDVLTAPAPDLEALEWKVNFLFGDVYFGVDGRSPEWPREFTDALVADVRRLNALANGSPTE